MNEDNLPPKPIDIAKKLKLSVPELLNGIDNVSSASLSELRKNNPKKYMMQMQGIICVKSNISIDELINYNDLKKSIINQDKLNK